MSTAAPLMETGPRLALWRFVTRMRLYVGCAVLGDGWLGMMRYYALLSRRAQDCITPDGQVILAKCEPLAEVLYKPITGHWRVSIERMPDGAVSSIGEDRQ